MGKSATIVGLMAMVVGACVQLPRATDQVKDPDAAIRIAQDNCVSPKVDLRQTGTWHAELRNGFWHVWASGTVCHQLDTHVRASDGKPDDTCVECVS